MITPQEQKALKAANLAEGIKFLGSQLDPVEYQAFTNYLQLPDSKVESADMKPSRIARAIYNAADTTPGNIKQSLRLMHMAVQSTPEYATLREQGVLTSVDQPALEIDQQFTRLAQAGQSTEFVNVAIATAIH